MLALPGDSTGVVVGPLYCPRSTNSASTPKVQFWVRKVSTPPPTVHPTRVLEADLLQHDGKGANVSFTSPMARPPVMYAMVLPSANPARVRIVLNHVILLEIFPEAPLAPVGLVLPLPVNPSKSASRP